MTIRFIPCTACHEGRDLRDGRVCWYCDGTGGEERPASPTVALVCGHPVRSSLRLARQHCFTCGFGVEVVDPARLDEQRARFADEMEARALVLEATPTWGWPEPSLAEQARLLEVRLEALITMRRVAGAMRARVGVAAKAA